MEKCIIPVGIRKSIEGLYVEGDGVPVGFRFLGVTDGSRPVGVGFDAAPALCPHCGAEGRWIYSWIENGELRGAMAGCFSVLVKGRELNGATNAIIKARTKQAKGESLNGWDRSILRMDDFMKEGRYDAKWCEIKILETVRNRDEYLKRKFR